MRQIVRPECLYEFTLKCMRDYYFDMVQEYKTLTNFEEDNFPMIKYIDKAADLALASKTTPPSKLLNIPGATRRLTKEHDPAHFKNVDLEDVLWTTLPVNPHTGQATQIDPIVKRTISKHHHLQLNSAWRRNLTVPLSISL